MGERSLFASALIACCCAHLFAAQPEKPCYAFLRSEDVHVTCGGKSDQITRRRDIESYAVSEEKATLAYVTSRVVGRIPGGTVTSSTATLIELQTRRTRAVEGVMPHIVATCGGIFPEWASKDLPVPANHDLVSGKEIDVKPYVLFRCSPDRAVVVGVEKYIGVLVEHPTQPKSASSQPPGEESDLREGTPPKTKIAAAGTFDAYGYNISPDGSKVAYAADTHPLCVFSSGTTQCLKYGGPYGATSINNLGEVLITEMTSSPCPGARSPEPCAGVSYWRPGLASSEFVEQNGYSPQWISPATAEILRKWSAQQGDRSAK